MLRFIARAKCAHASNVEKSAARVIPAQGEVNFLPQSSIAKGTLWNGGGVLGYPALAA